MDIAHLHFLVAEGGQAGRQELAAMLACLGAVHCTEAADGQAALRTLQSGGGPPVDIAVLDLALPGMDALELIRRLGEGSGAPALIVTGAHSSAVLFSVESMAQAYGLAMLGTASHPVTADKLATLIGLYAVPEKPAASPVRPGFTFAQIGRGLQARQFEPFFQPKIELGTGQVKGLEMFARWRHPEYGDLGPSAFIDVLKGNQRVDFLDWSMIEKSVEACRTLHERGIPLSVSINVAPRTLAEPSFLTQIDACLERYRLLPDYIGFEMTESAVLSTDPHFLERLLRLRLKGFGLAIDDYGTGRSNLQLLARIPFSELKIDRSFVDGAARRRPLGTVLASCLGLARSLERPSVAVGVETKEDWDFLQALGCTYAQGYYIARPMPVDAIPAWLDDWRLFF